jgi:diguanylate cyclase (GGDEF)-like protein
MILDTVTLRIAFAAMALILAVLFYFSTYRSTRSPYSAWWCAALLLFLLGAACFLMNDTPQQVWANPLGNVLLISGAACVWAGARSLRNLKPSPWLSVALPVMAGVAAAVDNPGSNPWAGGEVFLGSMAVLIGLASHELWRLEPGYSRVRIPMAIAAGGVAAFYFCRLIVFLADGQDGAVFVTFFGSAVTTMVTMVLLVVVSFSMAGLSTEQQTRALRTVATQDGLTGLLNRGAFLEAAAEELARSKAANGGGSLILADLDHFKAVNDTFGHAAGDLALQAFAEACSASVRSTDIAGRYGGEEFILLLPGAGPKSAEIIAGEISRRLAGQHIPELLRMPTVSYGISIYSAETADLDEVIAAADVALYEAKSQGRNRTVRG